jgi:polysaccharide export outer membrane protein
MILALPRRRHPGASPHLVSPRQPAAWRGGLLLLALCGALGGVQAQSPASTPAGSAASAEYRLGAGDVVRISVYQNPDLSLDARIGEGGGISYPLLGVVKLGGLTVAAAEKVIADGLRLGGFVKQPQVSVLPALVRGNQASVLGQANRPGRFPIEVADMRLTDLLALAGGVTPTGSEVIVVSGLREGQPFRREIDLPAVFTSPSRELDIPIQNGDVVWIDRAPLAYIYGEVQRPGPLRIERGMTLMQALATGGGITARGTQRNIKLHRRGPDGKTQVLEPTMDDRLQEGDVVYVRESLF